MRRARVAVVASLAALVAVGVAEAKYGRGEIDKVPVRRLIENLEKKLKANPRDAGLLLNVARLHAMTYATKADAAEVMSGTDTLWEGFEPARIPWSVNPAADDKAKEAAKAHLAEAIRLYRELVKETPKDQVGRLGLGWCLLQSGEKDEAREIFRKLVAEGWEADKKESDRFGYAPLLTEEAGGYLLPLLDPKKDAKEIAEIKERMAKLDALPRAVTPVLIPLDADARLDDLVARGAAVRFDVDGHERPGTWSWITPRAGWLVHLPPDGRREVLSGLQLFGTRTWWLFWKDGYEPLAALDDDGDGFLRGDELRGLGVWQDANSNGRCDPGEVRTLAECGIEALACSAEASERPDVARWNPRGVFFRGGSVRATWDVLLTYTPSSAPGGAAKLPARRAP
jgi:tetratricopeptide (TPR) repeat protein